MKLVAIYVEGYNRGALGRCWKVLGITPEGKIGAVPKDFWYYDEAIEEAKRLSKKYKTKIIRPSNIQTELKRLLR